MCDLCDKKNYVICLNKDIQEIENLEKELFPILSVADIRAVKKQLESAKPAFPPIMYYDKQALEALKLEFFKNMANLVLIQ